MTKYDIITTLKKQKTHMRDSFGVSSIGLFGSYAVDKQTKHSDIDIYVEFYNKTFDNIAGLWNYLERLFDKKIDLIHKHKNSNQIVIGNIQREVIYG